MNWRRYCPIFGSLNAQERVMAFGLHQRRLNDQEMAIKGPHAPASLIALIRLPMPRMLITRLRL